MNEYDSSRIKDLLEKKNEMTVTTLYSDADVLILNTCSIRKKSQEKMFSELGRWKKIKLKKPNTIICVVGCVASQEGKAIYQRAPYVNIVVGPQVIHHLPEMINIAKNLNLDIKFCDINNKTGLIDYKQLKNKFARRTTGATWQYQ